MTHDEWDRSPEGEAASYASPDVRARKAWDASRRTMPATERRLVGYWDTFNEEFVRTIEDAQRRQDGGNTLLPVYVEALPKPDPDPLRAQCAAGGWASARECHEGNCS